MSFDLVAPILTLALYLVAAVLYIWSLGSKRDKTGVAVYVSAAGLVAHTSIIVARGLELRRAPLTNLYESITFASWCLMALYLATLRKHRTTALGAGVSLAALTAVALGSGLPKGTSDALLPTLKSEWSVIHVASSLIGYAAFVLAFISAAAHMLQERLLKSKRIDVLQKRLPSLDAMDRFSYKMVAVGFPLFTLGVVTGALWAQTAWGSYWNWDPKETWALITWLVYAAYLHVRIFRRWRGKLANRLLVAGFVCVLVTCFGVNFLSGGLHRYSW